MDLSSDHLWTVEGTRLLLGRLVLGFAPGRDSVGLVSVRDQCGRCLLRQILAPVYVGAVYYVDKVMQ